MAEQVKSVDELGLGREIIRAQWGLLGQWYCLPADATPDEQSALVSKIKDDMQFGGCPDAYIADRLYGGFPCAGAPDRRHVYLAAGQYSFLAAQEGRFWANDAESRLSMWQTLLENNVDPVPPLDGPFTADAPRKETGDA
jgi:hypothetical protein